MRLDSGHPYYPWQSQGRLTDLQWYFHPQFVVIIRTITYEGRQQGNLRYLQKESPRPLLPWARNPNFPRIIHHTSVRPLLLPAHSSRF